MEWKEWLAKPFKLSPLPVSILVFLLYGGVFTAVFVTDQTPEVPKDLGGLDLQGAYDDLHRVSYNIFARWLLFLRRPRYLSVDSLWSSTSHILEIRNHSFFDVYERARRFVGQIMMVNSDFGRGKLS